MPSKLVKISFKNKCLKMKPKFNEKPVQELIELLPRFVTFQLLKMN